ncbi:hypothetical protein OBBRIDRAFT_453577 [Obba rivulosa]|uniref:Uncharacterized protein n=1 Tax=Obba rivulosa TaxID=1052685 RepID=A0A8E2AGI6_9APHY|nr:hypothetical protein OBBRIDRAFT_453577 [Obba rivulosa]
MRVSVNAGKAIAAEQMSSVRDGASRAAWRQAEFVARVNGQALMMLSLSVGKRQSIRSRLSSTDTSVELISHGGYVRHG